MVAHARNVAGPTQVLGGGRHRCVRPRTLHLVDLENLLGGDVEQHAVTSLWCQYRTLTGMRWDDHVIVAVSRRHAATAFLALPGTVQRVVGRNTADGADLALIDAVDARWAQRRFEQAMVATGDHIFAETARHLNDLGLEVVQVIGRGLPSAHLYRQCSRQLYLPAPQVSHLGRVSAVSEVV